MVVEAVFIEGLGHYLLLYLYLRGLDHQCTMVVISLNDLVQYQFITQSFTSLELFDTHFKVIDKSLYHPFPTHLMCPTLDDLLSPLVTRHSSLGDLQITCNTLQHLRLAVF